MKGLKIDKSELLEKAFINEDIWDSCYIDDNKDIWQPQFNKEGNIIKTGERLYQDWLENKDKSFTEDELVGDEEIAMAEAIIDLHAEIELLKDEIQLLKGE